MPAESASGRSLLFRQVCLQKRCRVRQAELVGPLGKRVVAGDFIVLDGLSRRNRPASSAGLSARSGSCQQDARKFCRLARALHPHLAFERDDCILWLATGSLERYPDRAGRDDVMRMPFLITYFDRALLNATIDDSSVHHQAGLPTARKPEWTGMDAVLIIVAPSGRRGSAALKTQKSA